MSEDVSETLNHQTTVRLPSGVFVVCPLASGLYLLARRLVVKERVIARALAASRAQSVPLNAATQASGWLMNTNSIASLTIQVNKKFSNV